MKMIGMIFGTMRINKMEKKDNTLCLLCIIVIGFLVAVQSIHVYYHFLGKDDSALIKK